MYCLLINADIDSMQSPYGLSVFEKASSRSVFCLPHIVCCDIWIMDWKI